MSCRNSNVSHMLPLSTSLIKVKLDGGLSHTFDCISSYIAQHPIFEIAQTALQFIAWQTYLIKLLLNFSGKHPDLPEYMRISACMWYFEIIGILLLIRVVIKQSLTVWCPTVKPSV